MSEKGPESQDCLQKDLEASSGRFYTRISSENPRLTQAKGGERDNTFKLLPFMTYWEPGYNAFVVARAAETNLEVSVVDSAGTTLDEIVVKVAGGAGYASGDRMRELAGYVADNVNVYIHNRWLCAR